MGEIMFDNSPDIIDARAAPANAFEALRSFLFEHQTEMLDAAALLAGTSGIRLANNILADFAEGRKPAGQAVARLNRFRDLLMLKNVHDIESDDSAFFAAICPEDPAVEKICLLADQLERALLPCIDLQVLHGVAA